jgi:hypothetical protein
MIEYTGDALCYISLLCLYWGADVDFISDLGEDIIKT